MLFKCINDNILILKEYDNENFSFYGDQQTFKIKNKIGICLDRKSLYGYNVMKILIDGHLGWVFEYKFEKI